MNPGCGALSLNRSAVRWRSWSGLGLEHLVLIQSQQSTEAQSLVISDPTPLLPDGFAARYTLQIDTAWRTVEVHASVLGNDDSVHLRRLPTGDWLSGNHVPVPRLKHCFDVDLSITPFTNTLPIRRLGLRIGEAAEITVAYISFPELIISAEPQRYTRLAPDRYRYQSMDSGFVREIDIDEHGLITQYPGLFRRV